MILRQFTLIFLKGTTCVKYSKEVGRGGRTLTRMPPTQYILSGEIRSLVPQRHPEGAQGTPGDIGDPLGSWGALVFPGVPWGSLGFSRVS